MEANKSSCCTYSRFQSLPSGMAKSHISFLHQVDKAPRLTGFCVQNPRLVRMLYSAAALAEHGQIGAIQILEQGSSQKDLKVLWRNLSPWSHQKRQSHVRSRVAGKSRDLLQAIQKNVFGDSEASPQSSCDFSHKTWNNEVKKRSQLFYMCCP